MRRLALMLLFAMFPAFSIQAGNLGRLFFTQEQRAQLEYSHARNTESYNNGETFMLRVNGVVQQRGGARTVWINSKAQAFAHDGEPATEKVAVPGKSRIIKIKVGEKRLLGIPDSAVPQRLPVTEE